MNEAMKSSLRTSGDLKYIGYRKKQYTTSSNEIKNTERPRFLMCVCSGNIQTLGPRVRIPAAKRSGHASAIDLIPRPRSSTKYVKHMMAYNKNYIQIKAERRMMHKGMLLNISVKNQWFE
jgi:hypothetical protein